MTDSQVVYVYDGPSGLWVDRRKKHYNPDDPKDLLKILDRLDKDINLWLARAR